MSDDEDDYLSDKFLVDTSAASGSSSSKTKPTTYSELRKEAQKKSHLKNEQNRKKSQKEVREEGLSKSLFERAEEEKETGLSSGSKALSMMMKMGFTPGQSLGKRQDEDGPDATALREPASRSVGLGSSEETSERDVRPPAPTFQLGSASTTTTAGLEETETDPSKSKSKPRSGHRLEPLPLLEWEGAHLPTSRPSSALGVAVSR
jgi:hypothetical protein